MKREDRGRWVLTHGLKNGPARVRLLSIAPRSKKYPLIATDGDKGYKMALEQIKNDVGRIVFVGEIDY
jgi:hypothetical protein